MMKLDRILCPTDLSTQSDEALRYAVALARAYDAKLLLLHCSQSETLATEKDTTQSVSQMNRLFSESLVPYLGLATMNELDWQGLVQHNVYDIGRTIVQEALVQNVDLIVMRSRRRPRAAVLLGSTAETVCRNALCPVLVTHPREREWVSVSSGEIDLNRVLIAHDFSRDAESAMNFGISVAQEYQAEIHLLHVLPTSQGHTSEPMRSSTGTIDGYPIAAHKLEGALPTEASLWCKVVKVVRCGKVHEEILNYAKAQKIDLICMGISRKQWTIDKLLGSNVDRVLRESPCPVLVSGYRSDPHRSAAQN